MIPDTKIQGQELLHLVMFGHLHFQSLWAGVDLRIFEILEAKGPLTLEQVAESAGLVRQPTKIVLVNLAALGLLDRDGEKFANGALARRFLLQSSEDSVVDVMRWQARIVYAGVEDYVRSLRENRNVGLERFPGPGNTLYERLTAKPELEKVFQDAMAGMPSNRFLADALPLSDRAHLCDCGGGAGHNAIAIAKRHPHLRITIFDHPTVCAKAQKNIDAHGLTDRISLCEGDFMASPFPGGVDSILCAHIINIFSWANNVRLFRRTCEALRTGGKSFIYNMVPRDDHSGPLSVTCGSVYFHGLASGQGFMYSAAELQAMLREAGFSAVEIIRGLPVSHTVVIGTK